MSSNSMSFLGAQLLHSVPMLLVYLTAIGLAVANLSRNPRPALLTLIGALVLVGSTVVFTVVQSFLMRDPSGNFAFRMAIFGLLSSVTRAVGVGLFVAAIFVDRNKDAAPR